MVRTPTRTRGPLRRAVVAALTVVTLLSLGACGSDDDEPAATTTSQGTDTAVPSSRPAEVATTATTTAPASGPVEDPCALITRAEAEALVGLPLQEGVVSGASSDSPRCNYAGEPTGPVRQVEVATGPGAKKWFDTDRDVLQHEFTEVPDIGDEAHEQDKSIFFRVGTTWVGLRVVRLEDADQFVEPLRAAARTAVDRLGA